MGSKPGLIRKGFQPQGLMLILRGELERGKPCIDS
jgi:hypothetical protein